MLDDLLSSAQNQVPDIKYQILYILAKEYYYFKEFDKALNYFTRVFKNRDLFVVYNIPEDTVIHLIKLTNADVSLTLYKTFITKECKEYFCKCNISNFISHIDNLDLGVYFVSESTVKTFVDRLMVANHYTEDIRRILLNFNNIDVFLYLSVFNNDKDYEVKIRSFNDKQAVDAFYMKYNIRNTLVEMDDENTLFFLYKKKRYKDIIKVKQESDFLYNLLYFSYYKLGDISQAEIFYDKTNEIIFPVDEIEYLHFKKEVSKLINKVTRLENPIDLLKSLEIFYSKKDFDILRECILINIYKFQDINVFKVLISYLLLDKLDLRYIRDYKYIDQISTEDKDWLYKIVYNCIIDDLDKNKEFVCLLNKLKNPCLDTVYIFLLTKCDYPYKDFLDICTEEDTNSDIYYDILTMYYEIEEDKDILYKLDISMRSNKQILSLLEISSNKDILLEAHRREILNPEILERGIIVNSVKGTLYAFLQSIYIINIKDYLSYNSKIILKREIEILLLYGDYSVAEFYKGLF